MLLAICDDEAAQLDRLEGYLQKYIDNNNIRLRRYDSGFKLLEEYENGKRYDVVFLDIMMKPMNGMDVAKRLRLLDSRVIIIFLTNLQEFAVDGYEVNAFRYLLKPLAEGQFDVVFNEALREETLRQQRYYVINAKENGIFKIDMDDIVYLESFGRNMIAHLNDRDVNYVENISSVEEKLTHFGFMRIHKSYIVNFMYVFQISRTIVALKDGTKLPLSRQRHKEVFDAFTRYLASKVI